MFYLVNTAHHHLDLPSALWTCVGSFSPLFISSTTTLVCWFTLRAKKPQQTDYRLAGEHSVTPFVVPYAKQISTSLKKKKKPHHWLIASNRNQPLVSQPNPDSSHRGLSGSFSAVIIPLMVLDLQQASTFQPITITSSRPLDGFITLYSIFVGDLVSQAKPKYDHECLYKMSEESIQYFFRILQPGLNCWTDQ